MELKNGSSIEILVHAAARSSAKDDARYRALAQAYLAFEPASKFALEEPLTEDESYHSDEEDEESAQSQLYDELLGATPKMSAVERPAMARPRSPDTDYGSSISLSRPPASRSFISLESPQASFASIMDNRNSPKLRTGLLPTESRVGSPQVTQQSQSEDSWIPPPSVLSDSNPQSQQFKEHTVYSSPTTVLQILLDQSQAVVQSPLAARDGPDISLGENRPTKRQRTSIKPKDTTLEVHPPAPRTSTSDLSLSSLITAPLQDLAKQLSLKDRYRHATHIRPVRPLERGYWLVDCQDWPSDLRKRSWEYLEGYIGRGAAGWGVWCTRDQSMKILRVYCWGEIVGHIYLLLYLVSQRKLKESGASWIDGEGKVVITMPCTAGEPSLLV